MSSCAGLVAAAAGGKPGGLGDEIDQQRITIRFDGDDRKALPKRKERINITHKNAGLLDVFARTNIINQIGVLVSVFPGMS
jgi:hypothetical protein